ncbi:SDR family NAD(P)-dependent oxidoreductase [Pseudonocardia sp. TRM90224]|uniref:SDR family NAD(P)-dependent oxidoreductase n=1 Tax=Pseudonocardia sp. TRM90224 TaxID=2812678 RepID=UPI001E597DA0|nr:SDR family oxidoreductase [Pseudonocardia sp. TRM90224]
MARFDGVTAVVTGAASGIGAATAVRLAAEGASVVLFDLDPAVRDVAASIGAASIGGSAMGLVGDVSDEAAWAEAAEAGPGPVGLLVSNACFVQHAPAHEMEPESWRRQIEVNLTATYLGMRALVPQLRAVEGAVVVVSSVHALSGIRRYPAYAASKGGQTALTRQLAVEYGPQVRVNAVLPGPIRTPVWDGVSEEEIRRSAAATAAGRLGTADEVAAAIAFLGSPEASYITGASLVVDGGWSVSQESA